MNLQVKMILSLTDQLKAVTDQPWAMLSNSSLEQQVEESGKR